MAGSLGARRVVLASWGLRGARRVAVGSRLGRAVEQGLPAAPERPHLELVRCHRLTVHAARNIGPLAASAFEEPSLATLQAGDVVGCAETRGAEKRDEVVHAELLQLGAFAAR